MENTEENQKKFAKALEKISNAKFMQLMKEEKEHPNQEQDQKFFEMLEKSTYFKQLFFRGFVEGMNFEKSNIKLVI